MILVSACLLGYRVRYDGGDHAKALLIEYEKRGKLIAVCPECFGGLPTPRPPAEIVGGDGGGVLRGACKVMNKEGADVTRDFVAGAEAVLRVARQCGIRAAILKERSPSCGVRQIYNGAFSGEKIAGQGVAAALLFGSGIHLYTEYDVTRHLFNEVTRRVDRGLV